MKCSEDACSKVSAVTLKASNPHWQKPCPASSFDHGHLRVSRMAWKKLTHLGAVSVAEVFYKWNKRARKVTTGNKSFCPGVCHSDFPSGQNIFFTFLYLLHTKHKQQEYRAHHSYGHPCPIFLLLFFWVKFPSKVVFCVFSDHSVALEPSHSHCSGSCL